MPKKNRTEILEYLRENSERIQRVYSLERMAMIGSIARGEYTDNSDVDIIVRFRPGTSKIRDKKIALAHELATAFHRPVDIASEKYIKPYYKTEILKEAVYV